MGKRRFLVAITMIIALILLLFGSCLEEKGDVGRLKRYAEDDFLRSWELLNPKPVETDVISVHYSDSHSAIVAGTDNSTIVFSDNLFVSSKTYELPDKNQLIIDIKDFKGNFVALSASGKIYKSSDGQVWSKVYEDLVNKKGLFALATGDKVVAVGQGGTIVYSSDLQNFQKASINSSKDLNDIAVSDTNIFVAVGVDSTICRSNDGTSFSCTQSQVNSQINNIAFGSGRFVAISSNNKVLISEDGGNNWAISDLGIQGVVMRLRYTRDKFVAVGENGLFATSNDGSSFVAVSTDSAFNFNSVTGNDSTYIMVGRGGLIVTSPDPSSAYYRYSPNVAGHIYSVYYNKGPYITAGKNGHIALSDDGVVWTENSDSKITGTIKSIASNGTLISEIFCAVGEGGKIYNTNDPSGEWFVSGNAGSENFNDIIYTANKFIAVGNNGALYISGNCKDWLKVTTNVSANLNSVIANGNDIIVVGDSGTVLKSSNPSGPYTKLNFPNSYNIMDLAYGNGFYLLVTQEGSGFNVNSRIYKSSDLSNFSLANTYQSQAIYSIAFGSNYFVMPSSSSIIHFTKDGALFNLVAGSAIKDFYDTKFIEGRFYIAGKDGYLLRSLESSANLEPQIVAAPDSVDFGDVVVNTTSNSEEIVVSNTGKGDLTISSVNLSGTNANQFSIISDSCSSATLNENGECYIYVDFGPTSTGSKTAVLVVSSNDPTHPKLNISLSGKGVTPAQGAISLDKQSIDFGSVKINTESASQSVVVKNVGSADLSVSSVYMDGNDSSEFDVKTDSCSNKTLAPSQTCNISVVFKPASVGSKQANLSIDSDDPNKPTAKVLLLGNGVDKDNPDIKVDRSQIDFGVIKVGTESSVESINVSNKGSAGLSISEVKLEGSNPSSFIIKSDGCNSKTLTPSSSCQIGLAFKPASEGDLSAILKIVSNDPDTPEYSVALSGKGRPAGAAAINVSPMSLSFGKVNTNTETAAQDINILSEGESDLSITSVKISGQDQDQFIIKSNTCPLKLSPNSSCKVSISFKPTKSGAKTAEVQIASNDPMLPVVSVSLSGEGVINKPSLISVSPSSYDFGKRIIGKVYPSTTFTVSNDGTGNLSIDSVSLDGTDKVAFSIDSDDCSGNQFAQDGKCYIKVNFKPDEVKQYSASLVINSNDSTAPRLEVSLKGEGIEENKPDAGVSYDVIVEEDISISTSDVKSKDESTSGCGCNVIE